MGAEDLEWSRRLGTTMEAADPLLLKRGGWQLALSAFNRSGAWHPWPTAHANRHTCLPVAAASGVLWTALPSSGPLVKS